MTELGTSAGIHRTRLKEKLLAEFPDVEVTKCGTKVVFFQKAFIYSENDDEDAKILLKAAKIVRKKMLDNKIPIDDVDQKNSVPPKLLTLLDMILRGPNLSSSGEDTSQASLTIAQLIRFNCTNMYAHNFRLFSTIPKFSFPRNSKSSRHSVKQETPLVRYLANILHHEKRAKTLINKFHSLGLCISYLRELEISTALGNRACDAFERDGVVVPRNIPKNQFVTMAVDNIDHNMSSTTSKASFHGTAVTVHTHPDSKEEVAAYTLDDSTDFGKQGWKLKPLPGAYTTVEPVVENDKKKIKTPIFSPIADVALSEISTALKAESDWIDLVESSLDNDSLKNLNVNWSTFHSNLQDKDINPRTIGLLPLFQESAYTAPMIFHAMKICKQVTDHLNKGQTPVCACDEPLFAIFKEMQWTYPEQFSNMVPMMGSLHIEMVILRCIGQLLQGSEWDSALAEACVASAGVAESFLTVSHVMKCRHAHQVTVAVLNILLRRAFAKREASESLMTIKEWIEKKSIKFPTFQYWCTVLDLEERLLLFVRSVREANFDLYVNVLLDLEPWFFALDHTKYSKWVAIHIHELMTLKDKFPDVYTSFSNGESTTKPIYSSFNVLIHKIFNFQERLLYRKRLKNFQQSESIMLTNNKMRL